MPDLCLIFILITFTIFASAYSLSTPAYEGPDEEAHHQFPSYETNKISSLPDSLVQTNSLYYLVLSGFAPIIDQHDDLGMVVNFGYPFDYKGRFHHGQNDIFPYAGVPLEVHLLRIISIFCGIITLIFTYKISRIIFGKNQWLALFSTALVSLIPTFIWISSVLNPDVFVWMFSTIAIFFILQFIKENFKTKFIILTGIFTGLAILSKANGNFLYPIIFSLLLYLVISKQIPIRNFLKYSIIFITVSIFSGAFQVPHRFLDMIFYQHTSFDVNRLYLLPSNYSPGLNYIHEHLLNPIFLHSRLIEFTFGGMGQNVIWIPKIFYFIADGFIIISLIGLFYILTKKQLSKFNIEKNYTILFLAPIFVFSIVFYNWISSEVGISRYTFPIISILGIVFTIGLSAFVINKKTQLLLFAPLIFLVVVNFVNITTIQDEFAFGLLDADGDGIVNELDVNPYLFSNDFSDKKLGGSTSGIIQRINPTNLTDSNPLKNEILREIRGWSPSFEHLQDLVPTNLYNTFDNREYELRNALDELVKDGKITAHGDAWTPALHKVWMQQDENGIRLRNDDSNTFAPIEIDVCDKNLFLNYGEEIVFSCNGEITIIPFVLKPLPIGIENGDLVQGENQAEVYLIQDGKKHHILTIEKFKELGFTSDLIKFIPTKMLDKIPIGPSI